MSPVSFLPLTESDAPALGRLRQSAWTATYEGIYPAELLEHFDFDWHKERDLRRIRDPGFHHFFLQTEGRTVGYLTLKEGPVLLLYSLYLLPEAQKHGIGRQAFAFVRDFCTRHQQTAFCCHCQPDNTNAMDFYRHMGGRIIARDEGNEDRWQDTVVFQFQV